MIMMPEVLYAKREEDGDTVYYTADANPEILLAIGEKEILGVYRLEKYIEAVGEITIHELPTERMSK